MFRAWGGLLFASMAMLASSGAGQDGVGFQTGSAGPSLSRGGENGLSVMTYNIKGLPWPVALGRDDPLARIADRLVEMRRQGRQAHIVLLQEAFSSQAVALARQAGYRHVTLGPDAEMPSAPATTATDSRYVQQARWDRGEGVGKVLSSGLMILSDYPVDHVDRMAFPDFACAGFDCLANKGVLIVHVEVPGVGRVSIVDTHLNARTAAGVPVPRSQQAYERQVELMARFVAQRVPRGNMVVLGGDMNIGGDPLRRRAFFAAFERSGLSFVTPALGGAQQADGLADAGERQDLRYLTRRGKDWIFARSATGSPLKVLGARVPFGTEPGGEPLSDHFGYVIRYAAAAPARHGGIHFASREQSAALAEPR